MPEKGGGLGTLPGPSPSMGTTLLQKPPRLQKGKFQSENADTRPDSAANVGPRDQALNALEFKIFFFSSSFFHQEIKNTPEPVYTKMSSLPESGVERLARGWRRGGPFFCSGQKFPEGACLPQEGKNTTH